MLFQLLIKVNIYLKIGLTLLVCHSIGSVLIKTIGLCLWYGSPLEITLIQRSLNYLVVYILEYLILIILLNNKLFSNQFNKISETKK